MGWCNLTTLSLGLWHMMGSMNSVYDAYGGCPTTLKLVNSDNLFQNYSIKDHIAKYSCSNATLRHATFHPPHHCEFLHFRQSFKQISALQEHQASLEPAKVPVEPKRRIVFVGDSLMAQTYVATMCSHEQHKYHSEFTFTFLLDVFLRGDIPCHPTCLNNASMYMSTINKLNNPCGACRDGKLSILADYKEWVKRLENRIPNDTLAIVIGVGSWFNNFQGVINSTVEFTTSLHLIKPFLLHLIHDRQIHVFWQGLPPLEPNSSVIFQGLQFTYEWFGYEEKDDIAKSIFASTPIHFLDVNKLTRKRKEVDKSIAADHVHWW